MNIADNHYPVYIDPTPEEIQAITDTNWDTIRILVSDNELFRICIASGYGHTHISMMSWLKAHFKPKRVSTTPAILFHSYGIAYINAGDMGGPDKILAGRAFKKYFSDYEVEILQSLAESLGKVIA